MQPWRRKCLLQNALRFLPTSSRAAAGGAHAHTPPTLQPHSHLLHILRTHAQDKKEMPRLSVLLVLLLGVFLPAPTTALYSARSDVVQLTEENFKVITLMREMEETIEAELE